MNHHYHLSLYLLLLLLATVALEGCKKKEPPMPPVEPLKIELPQGASVGKSDSQPLRYPDGSFNVTGLRSNRRQYMNQQLKIKGIVVEKYVCPEDLPKEKSCDRPHVFIGDERSARKNRILVCGFNDPEKYATLTVGETYIFSGTFGVTSGDGFTDTTGLLDAQEFLPIVP